MNNRKRGENMKDERKQLIAQMVKDMKQMDITSLLLVNNGVQVLRRKEMLDKEDAEKMQKTS